MAAAAVLYVLKLGGDLAGKLPSLSAGLRRAGEAALHAKANVVALGSAGRSSLNALGDHGKQAAEGAFKAAAGFAAAGFALHTVLAHQQDYEQSVARLRISAQALGQDIADAIGPGVASFIDRFTIGFTYLGTLLTGTIGPAFTTLIEVVGIFADRVAESLKAWKLIASGQFSAAAEILAGHKAALGDIVDSAKEGFAAIGKAQEGAVDAAFAAWRRQADGIKDVFLTIEDQAKAAEARHKALVAAAGTTPGAGYSGRGVAPGIRSYEDKVADGTISTGQGSGSEGWEPVASGVDKATEVLGNVEMGVSGILEMIPLYGKFLAGIWDFVSHMREISINIIDEITSFFSTLGDQTASTITEIPAMLIRALPKIITGIATLIPEMVLAFIAQTPVFTAAVVEAIIELPQALVEGFKTMFQDFWNQITASIDKITGALSNKDGQFLGTGLGAKSEGHRRFLGVHIPKLDSGGRITQTGLMVGHKGEVYSSPGVSRTTNQSHGPTNITMVMNGINNPDQFLRETRSRLGSFGVGLTFSPRGT